MDHPYPWLKYLPADDLDDDTVDFDGMKLEEPSGKTLGKVEGFIVDSDSGRPYYAVIDAGGWFKSKHFLLPVGHVRLAEICATFRRVSVPGIRRSRLHTSRNQCDIVFSLHGE